MASILLAAGVFTGVMQGTGMLKAMAQAGTRDPGAVNKAMRAMPVDWFGTPVALRADGRLMADVVTYRVKAPGDSRGSDDLYAPLGRIAPDAAYLPMEASCAG